MPTDPGVGFGQDQSKGKPKDSEANLAVTSFLSEIGESLIEEETQEVIALEQIAEAVESRMHNPTYASDNPEVTGIVDRLVPVLQRKADALERIRGTFIRRGRTPIVEVGALSGNNGKTPLIQLQAGK